MTDRAALIDRLRAGGCVFAEDEADILLEAGASPAELTGLVQRRLAGEPLEYLVGWVAFGARRIVVEPGVFVPRRRTELMATVAVSRLRARTESVLVELCCGAAAVATVVADAIENLQVVAADCDPVAVHCAGRNLSPGQVYEGDLYRPLPAELRGRVDALVANAPYVPRDSIALMPPEARLYEARVALDGGPDGLDVLRRIIVEAPSWLAPDGVLLVEAGADQRDRLTAFAAAHGLNSILHTDDEIGATVVELARVG